VSVVRLNHAVLFVTDVARAGDFYAAALGFEIVSAEPQMNALFMKAANGTNHHDLGLFGLGPHATPKGRSQVGLYHLAWQVATIDDLAEARTKLIELGGYTGESSHGATKSIYGADPDGNELEIMWLLPREAWGEYADKAVVERLDLEADIARWSGVATA
jgi:catechol-2,3-dioxygenase